MPDESIESVYEFGLEVSFEYAHKGEGVKAEFISLYPPTSRHMSPCSDLKQAVFRSLPEPTKEEIDKGEEVEKEKDKEVSISGPEILLFFYKSREVELKKVILLGRELLCTKPCIAFVDGEEKINSTLLDKMDPMDLEQMIGEYIARFIAASAWRVLNKI